MFSLKHFSLKKCVLLTLFLYTITFLIAYFTGLTGESKHLLLSRSSLIRRAVSAVIVGIILCFMNLERRVKSASEE
ncbi:MAG: hypothetical protein V4539_11695 [Bacteroidota bacterium]